MRIRITKLGRVAYPELRELARVYLDRLRSVVKIECEEIKDPASISAARKPGTLLIVLDERGKEWSSKELAAQLQKWQDDPGVKEVHFLIGDPMGLPPAIRDEARGAWSLSKATFTSDMSWLLCLEQLYRGYSILKNTGYHHE